MRGWVFNYNLYINCSFTELTLLYIFIVIVNVGIFVPLVARKLYRLERAALSNKQNFPTNVERGCHLMDDIQQNQLTSVCRVVYLLINPI